MKKDFIVSLILLLGILTVFEASIAFGKSTSKKVKTQKLSTDLHFDDLSVKGRYQVPGEGLVVVEDEKLVDDLLGYRTHFKDRIQRELSMKSQKGISNE